MALLPPRKKFGSNLRPVQTRTTEPDTVSDPWLDKAREAFEASTSFIDTNYRKNWEDSIAHFQSRHMQGSKYFSETYKYRSKMFRPKTRSTGRQLEAATAAAFFSQLDILSHEPEDDKDPLSLAGSALRQELINYRLSRKGQIPWFQVCVGAMQEVFIYGLVVSKQFWEYQEREVQDEFGEQQKEKIKDQPDIKLCPIENIRFDPASEWTDVVNTSPYFISMESMRIGEVKAKIKSGEWEKVEDKILMSARNQALDPIRQARSGEKEDETDPHFSKALSDFDIVWVHENFLKEGLEDYHCYTLGTVAKLTKPRKLQEVYLHGVRPFVAGTCMIQPHISVPDSPAHLSKSLNKEANEIANTRLDNVKLALHKRYLVKRGKQVDLQSLVRNAPASITLVNDVEGDVKPFEFNDVTSSSYAEQDRINNDMDDLMGSFSQGSVSTNRKLNETVGGMAMLRGSSNSMTQYVIRVFSETWVEKVLNQVDMLEQHYESNMDLLNLMGRRAGIEKYGIPISKEMLMAPSQIMVNIANSAMDPMVRLQAFTSAMDMYAKFRQIMPPDMDPEPVKAYIFGLLGFRDASRFSVDSENPQLAQAMQTIQQLQQALEGKQMEMESKEKIETAKLMQSGEEIDKKLSAEIQIADQRNEVDLHIAEMSKNDGQDGKVESHHALELIKIDKQGELESMRSAVQQDTEIKKATLQGAVQIEISRINAMSKAAEKTEQASQAATNVSVMERIMDTQSKLLQVISAPRDFIRGKDGRVSGSVPRVSEVN